MLKSTKPCMIIWPASVPTADEDRPEASNETPKTTLLAPPSNGVSVWNALLDRRHVTVTAVVKDLGGHKQHRHINGAGQPHGADDIDNFEVEDAARFLGVAPHDAPLGQAGVQIDHVRHHRGAHDADHQQHAVAA